MASKLHSSMLFRGDGVTTKVALTFPLEHGENLEVKFGRVVQTKGYTVDFKAVPVTVTFDKPLPKGEAILIRRNTVASEVPYIFQDTGNAKGGAEFNAKNIDENFKHMSKVVVEVDETSNRIIENMEELEDKFDGVLGDFSEVKKLAEGADKKADSAISTANKASTDSKRALKESETANSNSKVAITTSYRAEVTANTALEEAEGAVITANTAKSTADTALTKASKAETASSNAESVAKQASKTAGDALEVAEGIEAKADQAVETANEASGTANVAWETATGIAGVANDALETATTANEKAQEALEKATEGGITETELIEKSLGDGKWIRDSKLKEEIDAIPKPDMSEYRKLDNTDFVARVSIFSEDRSNYVQLVADQSSNAYLASWGWGVGKVWYALPLESGTLALKSQVDTKWEVQTTVGTGDIARMSEVTKKADTSYVNTELGKKRDKDDMNLSSITIDSGDYSQVVLRSGSKPDVLIERSPVGSLNYILRPQGGGAGSNLNTISIPLDKKSGTIALTSDVPSLSGYATQSWVNSKGYITLGTANANSTKLGAEQYVENSSNTDVSINYYRASKQVPDNAVLVRVRDVGTIGGMVNVRVYYRPITRL